MLKHIKKLFGKGDEDIEMHLPQEEKAVFKLIINEIEVGVLKCEKGEWVFKYSDEFKKHTNEYKNIIGFPQIDKEYRSDSLWPFFRIRIPGLKQPAVREILEKEHIDKDNEVALLKRFGRKTISNPYELLSVG